ncbi:tyrosine-type recombinase/integrase [Chelatococcus reniformis]|uniref:Integrase n=1 Tax=Chelatococcus reniformis TaxID=1494448 RepID=A0A916UEQ6_9HYPH|nr:tyrosine-type recombinase/integrase [Chelatococcus reniformis]GGC68288.1 integrase [Chelatococcus reniformis]
MGEFLTKRDGFWHFVRRVPENCAELDRRGIVKQSTRIKVVDDPRGARARRETDRINGELEAYWRGLLDGQSAEAQRRYDAARRRARSFGFDYAPAADIAARPAAEIVARVEAAQAAAPRADEESAVTALLGGEGLPEIKLTTLFDEFEKLQAASIKDLSEDQRRKWRNPKKRALANLLSVVADKSITALTRSDALDFRAWWQDRILADDLDIGTANKDIGHLNKMFRTINTAHKLGLSPVFGELRIEGEESGSRLAFEPDFLQKRILAVGALDDLNDEARRVIYLMVETGLRPSEVVNLTEETIVLDHDVPHIKARPDGRRMKTAQSARDIPLVGVSLLAAQAQPKGFPRYRDKGATLSATVNKTMRAASLLPADGHTLYSIRHTFEDRLTAIDAPDKMIAMLMGHKFQRPKYGAGPTLAHKREWLQRIALLPPSRV